MRYLVSVIFDEAELSTPDEMALKPATEGSKACNRKVEVRPSL